MWTPEGYSEDALGAMDVSNRSKRAAESDLQRESKPRAGRGQSEQKPPTAQSSNQPRQQQQQVGGRGKGQKGRGKGGEQGDVWSVLEDHRKMLSRVAADRRIMAQSSNFILEVPESDSELRGLLQNAADKWKQQRPSKGPHPDGAIHHVLWTVFCNKLANDLGQSECVTAEQKAAIESQRKLLEGTFVHSSKREAIGPTVVQEFHSLGRKPRPPENGPWLWILKFSGSTSQGRDLHESFLERMPQFQLVGIVVRKDRGTMDELERRIQNVRLG